MLRKYLIFLFAIISISDIAFAQNKAIIGTVTNENGIPIAGALVKIKGTNISAISDKNGNYSINVPENASKIVVSHDNMKSITSTIADSERINIQMKHEGIKDIFDMSLEEIMDLEVTSVTKKAEHIKDVPSSVYVITSKDIERSSAQNLMQLLRDNVPGYWAVQNDYKNVDGFIRTINGGSVLILLDGTPILDITSYNLDYESFDIPFHQIDRIEVIKGSGGTVYGTNSASGVINIYTKNPDKQDKLFISTDYSIPGKFNVNIIGSPIQHDKFSSTIYSKINRFSGFEQIPEIKNTSSYVPKQWGSGDTLIYNRFTEDDKSFTSINAGLNIKYIISEDLKLSSNVNFVNAFSNQYRQTFDRKDGSFILRNGEISPILNNDSVFLAPNNKTRVTANIRSDYSFSETHNLFARISTNMENRDYLHIGGTHGNNCIYDIELQDNITFGLNNLSVGINYRIVNSDILT